MPNLVKLYTHNGTVWIDTAQHEIGRTQLTIYTSRGNRLCDTVRGQKDNFNGTTVHRDNLFASKMLAYKHREAIYSDMRARSMKSECAQTA